MEVQELRIGNLVIGISNLPETIELITNDRIDTDNHDSLHIKQIQPILITQEWLLKFGFEKDGIACLTKFYKGISFSSLSPFKEVHPCTYIESTIEYAHQLQNLYFALTNEELTINK
jgi:hypothetical protein